MAVRVRAFAVGSLLLLLCAAGARAASVDEPTPMPAGPLPPDVISRDASGEVIVRAVRIGTPLKIDGQLDEPEYESVRSIDGFIQQEPHGGEPATEPTEVWIFFDDTHLYLSARLSDSHPERAVATELRRDGTGVTQNDNLMVLLDTFRDRRNGFTFQTNPVGAFRDQTVTEETGNAEWNTVWDVRSVRSDTGWTTEMAIPFKSLRYKEAGPQVWGINMRRIVKWKNEVSYLTAVPVQYGLPGILKGSVAATLVGLETPAASRNIELKPYAVSSVVTDRASTRPVNDDVSANAGFDFKYGLTRGLIADFTVNTDFAQVEEDVQQVNLTRFSLFFPEKRDFFMEGQGIFSFGGVQVMNGVITVPDVPVIFFSRRIGISQGQTVPVIAGGRVTGRVGRYSVAALSMATGDKPEAAAVTTGFTAVRIKRDFLRRSAFGVIGTARTPGALGANADANNVLGADVSLLLLKNVTINSYYARLLSRDIRTGRASYRGRYEYAGDRYGMAVEHLTVDPAFNPEIGYVRRMDMRRNSALLRFSPRPAHSTRIRKLTWQANLDYITDARLTAVQNREWKGTFTVDFQSGDQLTTTFTDDYELLPRPFAIATGVIVPAGGYNYDTSRVSYTLGTQRRISGTLSAGYGSLYDGTRTEAGYNGRVAIRPQLAVEPGATLNWVDLPVGSFTATLINARIIVTPTPRLLVSSLIQYNASAHSLQSSVRLHWEYTGGSELFVVYSDGRDTAAAAASTLLNRSFAVKVTRLLRF